MITIILTPMTYYAREDEDAMFYWLDKIKAVKSYKGIGRELHVYFESNKLTKPELRSLKGLFKRYNFENVSQLDVFQTEDK